LARETPADRVNGNSIGSKLVGGEFTDVAIAFYLRPVLGQNLVAIGVNLALGDGLEPAAAFKTKLEAAYASKQGKEAQLVRHATPPPPSRSGTKARLIRARPR
jgi:hypothetical protein